MRKIFLALFLLTAFYAKGQQPLDLKDNNDYSTFAVFDSMDLSKYNLFFTGEDHRYPLSNSDVELKMFKYLYKTAGVRMFMVEFGQGMGYLMNKYIYEGDSVAEKILEKHSYKAYFKLFTLLKEFNDSLPEKDKFRVSSVDIEREPLFAIKYIETLLPKKLSKAHDSIKIHVEAIKAVSEYYDDSRSRYGRDYYNDDWSYDYIRREYISPYTSMDLVLENFESHKEKYKALLKDNYQGFENALGWLKDNKKWRALTTTAQQYLFRETYMANNVKRLFSENPNLKVYGQFGRCHTQLEREQEECNYYYFNSLATRLNNSEHPQLDGKVFSCPIFYTESYSFNNDIAINDGLYNFSKKAPDNALTAFAIDTAKQTDLKDFSERFNVVIFNTLERDKSQNFSVESENAISKRYNNDYYWNERFLILAEGGMKGYNFSNLNKALGTDFPDLMQYFGVSMGYAENWGFNATTAFLWYPTMERNLNDSTSSTLSGFNVSMRYAKDLLKPDNYDLNIGMGFGYERWSNKITEEFTDESRKDVFGNNRSTLYTNPAFVIDAGLNFRVHISRVTFGVYGRYQLDLSNRNWRVNGELQPETPKLSLNAYSVGFTLGLNFE